MSIQVCIKAYKPPKQIADAMLELDRLKFKFSGHGCGWHGEDFFLTREFGDEDVSVCLLVDDKDKQTATLKVNGLDAFSGTPSKTINFIKAHRLHTKAGYQAYIASTE